MYRSNDEVLEPAVSTMHRSSKLEHKFGCAIGRAVKRIMDVIGALLFLTFFLPLFVFIAIGVMLTSPGPILYVQERIGLHGRVFRFYKFRSMVVNSDEVFRAFLERNAEARSQWERYQKLDKDPRITNFGNFIRRTSLDEFPQIWNVLRGDMSLVGPRPCMPQQRVLYGVAWDRYISVRPGLTGLWQVSGRNKLTYEQRVDLDASYVQNRTLWLDLKILVKTFRVVLTGHGSR